MRLAVVILVLGVSLSLAGCSWLERINPWSSGKPRNLPAQLEDLKQTRQTAVSWSLNIGSSDNFIFSPVVVNEHVYAASAKGTIVKVDPQSGQEVWRADAGMSLTAGVGTDGSTLVVAARNGALLAYDTENGKQKWKAQLTSEALSAPAVGEDIVVVRSMDNRIAGFDAASGERKWMVTRRAPVLMLRSAPGIATLGPTAIVALPGGRLVSMMLATGATNWEVSVADPKGTTDLERIADTSGLPAVLGRMVCVASYQGRVACFDAVTGGNIWAKELSSEVGVSLDEQYVFVADEAGSVYAFTNTRGQSVWRNEKLSYRALTTPVPFDNTVVAGDLEGFVHFFSRDDGALVARMATDGSAIKASPVVAGDKLIIQTSGGRLQALMVN